MHCIKKSLLVLTVVAASAAVPAQAGAISYEFGAALDTAAVFNQTVVNSFRFDDAEVNAPGFYRDDLYSLAQFSFDVADSFYTQSALSADDAALPGNQLPRPDAEVPAFALLPANAISAAGFSYGSGSRDTDNEGITYLPLLGPVPEPSMTRLMVGGLLALAGLSSGTRGIHESV